MSKRVLVTCSLLLLIGVAGGLDTASAFSRGETRINLLILLLPPAIGLFAAVPGARLAASVVFSILYLVLALLLVGPMLGTTVTNVTVVGVDLPLLASFAVRFVLVAMLGSLLALLHWMLFSPPFEEYLKL